jgi:hypothetical protein
MAPANDNGWREWKEAVLGKLETIEAKIDCLEKRAYDNNARISVVETKAKLWGATAGLGAAILAQIVAKLL